MRKRSSVAFATVAYLVAICAPAGAVDGVVEISQAKVLANGGHFPYVISSSGSYRLTSNLDVAADNTNPFAVQDRRAISITAANVTVDLNGFSILGGTSCSGTPTVCTPTGTGEGITSTQGNVTVRNGTIQGMGGPGVELFTGSVEGLTVANNGSVGIAFSGRGLVSRCTATTNGAAGISVSAGEVESCIVRQQNSFFGISALGVVRNNYVEQTGIGGAIQAGESVIANNSMTSLNSTTLQAFSSTVIGNWVWRSSGSPAAALSGAGYTQNRFRTSSGTDHVQGGVNLGANACDGFACP